jgi:hypothetical protein
VFQLAVTAEQEAAAVDTAAQWLLGSLYLEVIFCKPPNSTFEAVSEPVSATPSQPSKVSPGGIALARRKTPLVP